MFYSTIQYTIILISIKTFMLEAEFAFQCHIRTKTIDFETTPPQTCVSSVASINTNKHLI